MGANSALAVSQFVASLLSGYCSTTTEVCLSLFAIQWAICAMDGDQSFNSAFRFQSLYNGGNATFESISTAIDGLVTAVSDSFRLQGSYGSAYEYYPADPSNDPFLGQSESSNCYLRLSLSNRCLRASQLAMASSARGPARSHRGSVT